ncbi:unnamed protein product, partial [Symbiodinium sp. CCMP2456]
MQRGRLPGGVGRAESPSALLYGRFRQRREQQEPTKDVADIVTELLSPAQQPSAARSSARVLECLEVALAKLDREPAWRLAGSGFFDRTVGSMVAAILAEIEAFRADRPWLASGVEAFQERLQQFTSLQAEEEARWKDEDILSCANLGTLGCCERLALVDFCQQLEKSRAELQEAARCQRIEEDQMQTTRATLQALQQRAHEAEEMRLQEQQRQREQLLEYKDGLRHLLGKLREEYDQDMAALKQVQEEEQKLEYAHKLTMVEVADLSELEEALAKLE